MRAVLFDLDGTLLDIDLDEFLDALLRGARARGREAGRRRRGRRHGWR